MQHSLKRLLFTPLLASLACASAIAQTGIKDPIIAGTAGEVRTGARLTIKGELVSASGAQVDFSTATVTLPSDVTRLGSSIDLLSEVTAAGATASQIYRRNAAGTGFEFATISPTITLGGQLSGNVTLTNLGNATLTAALSDADLVAIAALNTTTGGRGLLELANTVSVGAVPYYGVTGGWQVPDTASTDPAGLLVYGAPIDTLYGGRLNKGAASGELPIPVFDADLVPQYSLVWGWSQVTLGLPLGYGSSSKGSTQTGYNNANAGPYAQVSGYSNVNWSSSSTVAGNSNVTGSTDSTAPLAVTYHDNWSNGATPRAQIKVSGDRTAQFGAGEYAFLWFIPASGDGSLSTRTSDTAGVLTVEAGGGANWQVGNTVRVNWNGGDSWRTLVLTAAVQNSPHSWTLTGSGGSGTILPAANTKVFVTGGSEAPRTFRGRVASSSHSAGVTTINFDSQFAASIDLTQTGRNAPWVMSGKGAGAGGTGFNAVFGTQNWALGRAGFAAGEANTLTATSDESSAFGTLNTLSGQASFAAGSNITISSSFATGFGQNHTISGLQAAAVGGLGNTASGARTGLVGGSGNTASADTAAVVGGSSVNVSSGFSAALGGQTITINATRSGSIGGGNNTVSGSESVTLAGTDIVNGGNQTVAGGSSITIPSGVVGSTVHGASITFTATGDYAAAAGATHTVGNPYTHVSGKQAVTRRYGELLHSSGSLSGTGRNQSGMVMYAGTTTNNSATDLFIDYSEASPSERFSMTTNSVVFVDLKMIAHVGLGSASDAVQQVAFTAQGLLSRSSSGGSYSWAGPTSATRIDSSIRLTSISGNGTTVTATSPSEHFLNTGDTVTITGSSVSGYNGSWTVTRVSNTSFTWSNATTGTGTGAIATATRPWTVTLGVVAGSGLRIQVTGETGKTIRWTGRVDFTEQVY